MDDDAVDEDFTSDTLEVINGSEYNDIDAELPCYDESDELDDEIVETIIAKRPCLQDSDSDNETTDDTPPVTRNFTYSTSNATLHNRDSMMKPTTFWINVPI